MKIAYLVNDFPSITQTFVLKQIIGMIDRGHQVDIFTFRLNPPPFEPIVTSYRLLEKTQVFCKMHKSRFKRLLILIGLLMKYRAWRKPLAILKGLNIFKYGKEARSLRIIYDSLCFLPDGKYDIIHCQFGMIGPRAIRLKEIGAISGKVVTSFRGYDTIQYLKENPGIYYDLFKEGDYFFPVCCFFRNWLVENGCSDKKISVIHSGIDCRKITFSSRRLNQGDTIRVVTIARLVEKKGVAYAIQAIARLISKGFHIQYTVVGEGPLKDELIESIKVSGAADRIKLIHWLHNDDVLKIMQNSHILLAPSITAADGDMEGIPNVLKEGMAMGLPVVSTSHSGIPELVQDGISGFIVPERDVDALVERICFLIHHPELWPGLAEKGREIVEREYDIRLLNDRLEEKYKRIVNL